MKYFKNVLRIFYPEICCTCTMQLLPAEKLICTLCRHDLPTICYKNYKDNKIKNGFSGRIPIEKAISFLFYRREGMTKKLIHQLKYKGNQQIGDFIGDWFGNILKNSNEFDDIDYIIPVPLHRNKFKKRGYNQLTAFGKKLAKHLGTIYVPNLLIRTSTSKTQTFKQRFDRFSSIQSRFHLTDHSFFKNKHVLLIDDVITTGATLEACCNELLKTNGLKISIVTMAYTE